MCPDSIDGSGSVLWSTGTRSVGTPQQTTDTEEFIGKSALPSIPDVSTEEPSTDANRVLSAVSTPVRNHGMTGGGGSGGGGGYSTTRESFESEMTQAVGPGVRHIDVVRNTESSGFASLRESSQTTVNCLKPEAESNSSDRTAIDRDLIGARPISPPTAEVSSRDSNMLEITEEEVTGGYLARSVIAPGVYYLGIIDILQKWTWEKRLER